MVAYDIYINGAPTPAYTSNASNITANGLNASTTYTFTVKARDLAGNSSAASSGLTVTTPAAPDIIPPSVPANLISTGSTVTSVSLDWENSTDNVGVVNIIDVSVEWITQRLAYTSPTSNVVANGLVPNTAYTFTVKARGRLAGNASAASTGLTVTTPADINTAERAVQT